MRESVTVAGRAERARVAGRSRPGCSARGTHAGMTPRCWSVNRELFANSIRHSGSGAPGEMVTVEVRTGHDVIRASPASRLNGAAASAGG